MKGKLRVCVQLKKVVLFFLLEIGITFYKDVLLYCNQLIIRFFYDTA